MTIAPPEPLRSGAGEEIGRVAFFMHGFEVGGAQAMTIALAGALARQGVPVDIVVAHGAGPLRDTVPETVRVVELQSGLLRLARKGKRRHRMHAAVPALARYLRTEAPSILVGAANHASISTVLAHMAARRPAIKLVLRATNPLSRTDGSASRLKRLMSRLTFRRAHRVVAVSGPVAEDYGQVAGLAAERVCVIPEPAIKDDFAARLAAPGFHPWLEEDGQRPLVLSIGRLARQKDYPTLLDAWALVHRRRPEARLLIVGEGPERERLTRQRDSLNLRDVVAFAGAVLNPLPALRHARCLALSSRWEGLGVVAVEALAAGCPVVATDTPAVRWVLEDGALGRLSPVGDAQALAESLLAALDDPVRVGMAQEQPVRDRVADFTCADVSLRYVLLFRQLRGMATDDAATPAA